MIEKREKSSQLKTGYLGIQFVTHVIAINSVK